MGNIQKAAALFEEVQKADPENLQARTLLADCYSQMGEYKKVISQLDEAAEKHPEDRSIAYLLGTAYLRDKQIEKGQRLLDRILRQGDSAEAHLMMGIASLEAYENKKAVAEFEQSITINPNLPLAHSSLGQAFLRSGDAEKAVPQFEAELKINPNDFTANLHLGLLLRRNNQQDEALPFFLRAFRKATWTKPSRCWKRLFKALRTSWMHM